MAAERVESHNQLYAQMSGVKSPDGQQQKEEVLSHG